MANREEREAEDAYERENDRSPVTQAEPDDSYMDERDPNLEASVPVQSDTAPLEDPVRPFYADTDQQLAEDERDVLDQSQILGGDRLRHTKPRTANKYNEGPGEEELPEGA
ncbi:uncharacterized protein N7459_001599 [Penicillium hispanicum]|uniref:uncharacterized protein n=1 Tax=Penicillium hispanicum TaxID=1080232 RepID=UPI0025417FA2|nr:uncharacterized protein N7459_001599 [Penicillium hispanicum]KAJ5595391.1 hypothetical protein N7459_001599 [Penicillium hispanicum]